MFASAIPPLRTAVAKSCVSLIHETATLQSFVRPVNAAAQFSSMHRSQHHGHESGQQNSWFSSTNQNQQQQLHLRLTADANRAPGFFPATVVDKQLISSTVVQLVLDASSDNHRTTPPTDGGRAENKAGDYLQYRAGQWVDMYIPGEPVVGGFSIVSAPYETQQTECVKLAVKYTEHPPARWCHSEKCEIGTQVQLRVGGDFSFAPEQMLSQPHETVGESSRTSFSSSPSSIAVNPVSLLLIAGGVGINPLISIYKHFVHLKLAEQCEACARDDELLAPASRSQNVMPKMHRLYLLYSAQTPDELIFRHDIEKGRSLCYPDVNCSYFCTRLPLTSDASHIVLGAMTTTDNIRSARLESMDVERALEFLTAPQRHSASNAEILCYVCGPQPFMEGTLDVLSKYPNVVKPTNVKYEKWW